MELVVGRYPIPAPTRAEYARIFGFRSAQEVRLDAAPGGGAEEEAAPAAGNDDSSPKTMAIFELLDYIVNKVVLVFFFKFKFFKYF